jgi:hypothetical protein
MQGGILFSQEKDENWVIPAMCKKSSSIDPSNTYTTG